MLRNFYRGGVILLLLFLNYNSSIAQENHTLTFLGIPVDGTKGDMIKALSEKGFSYDKNNDMLVGTFNGQESTLFLSTNGAKIDRIVVAYGGWDINLNEADVIKWYNNLFEQFTSNPKYIYRSGRSLPPKEDVSYEMTCNNETYDASFIAVETLQTGLVWFRIINNYGRYGIAIYYENLRNRPHGEDL